VHPLQWRGDRRGIHTGSRRKRSDGGPEELPKLVLACASRDLDFYNTERPHQALDHPTRT